MCFVGSKLICTIVNPCNIIDRCSVDIDIYLYDCLLYTSDAADEL